MRRFNKDILRLLKESADLGITAADYHKFRILIARGDDPRLLASLTSSLAFRRLKQSLRTNPFDDPELSKGDLLFGMSLYGFLIYILIQWLNAGTLLIANTGSGKTTLVMFWAVQIAHRVCGMWLVDLRKKEFRFLKKTLSKQGIELVIIRARQFRVNPLQVPEGVEPQEYASIIAELLVQVLDLPHRAEVLLKTTIIKLYHQYGMFNGGRQFPTLFHLFEAIKKDRRANPQARQAILDHLEMLLLSLGPQVLAYHQGWDIHQLAKSHCVFELAGVPQTAQDLLQNYPIVSEFTCRIAKGISNPKMDLWICFDEGQRLFSQRKEVSGYHGNAITDMAGLVRGTGIGLNISVLSPDGLSSRMPAITSTKIMGRCGSMADYKTAGGFMGLSRDQMTWCAHHLVPGLFVGQVSEGRWRYPFLFKVPPIRPGQRVSLSDHEADESLKSLHMPKLVPAVEFTHWNGIECVELREDTPDDRHHGLSDREFKFLCAVVNNPMQPSSQYARLAGISPNTALKVRRHLVENGWIREHQLQSGTRGRSTVLLEPLEKAKAAVANDTKGDT